MPKRKLAGKVSSYLRTLTCNSRQLLTLVADSLPNIVFAASSYLNLIPFSHPRLSCQK